VSSSSDLHLRFRGRVDVGFLGVAATMGDCGNFGIFGSILTSISGEFCVDAFTGDRGSPGDPVGCRLLYRFLRAIWTHLSHTPRGIENLKSASQGGHWDQTTWRTQSARSDQIDQPYHEVSRRCVDFTAALCWRLCRVIIGS
jgi:hypothetical protein